MPTFEEEGESSYNVTSGPGNQNSTVCNYPPIFEEGGHTDPMASNFTNNMLQEEINQLRRQLESFLGFDEGDYDLNSAQMFSHGNIFHPTEEELICYYLKHKMNGRDSLVDDLIGEADLYRRDPWELPVQLDARQLQSLSDSHGMDFDFFPALQSQNHVQNNNQEVDARLLQSLIDSHGMDIDFFSELQSQNHVQNNNQEVVNAEQLQSLVDSQEVGFNFPFALQSQNRVQNCLSDEEDMIGFADSLLIDPNECGVENPAHPLLNDYIPSRSSSKDYVLDSSDRETYLAYGEENVNGSIEVVCDFPFALQSQNRVQNCLSDEEDTIGFADSLLNDPDECVVENYALALVNDYIPSRSSSEVYVLDDSDRETYLAYGESSNLYGGHGSAKEHRQMQMAQSDDILLMGSSKDSTTATRHEQINFIQPVGVDFPRIHKPQNPPRARSFLEHEGISAKGDQLECGSLSIASKHKARDRAKQVADIDLPKKAGIESEKDRKIVQVTNAKPDVKTRSDDSVGNERRGLFIHLDTATSSHLSSPSSVVYLLNSVLGLVLFIIMLREVLIVH
ncbi:hypothetical protein SADUNF_Sadunf02G0153400 [Salix dunnii]|uniref:NAC domain-containing protein n=1 Tax=Salix dunnii TaxID=1413687 RepID=A0A835N8F5_9ROSI|nr:hypothetical protein SADUNF_Sadunf02G0153400 [Salix dunnii]